LLDNAEQGRASVVHDASYVTQFPIIGRLLNSTIVIENHHALLFLYKISRKLAKIVDQYAIFALSWAGDYALRINYLQKPGDFA
jgi:hypothetical protein